MGGWVVCGLLAALAAVLAVRVVLLQRALQQMACQLPDRLEGDTNNPIYLSTRDPYARQLAAQLNRQLARLRQAQLRYELGDRELKEAMANLSHDLRTPLTAICSYLELLRGQQPAGDTARYLALMEGRARLMARLLDELMQYSIARSGGQGLQLGPVELAAALQQSLAGLYGPLTRRGIRPNVALPGQKVIRRLDAGALGRVLDNILGNALKYSAGDLSVSLTPAGEMTFSNRAPGLDGLQVAKLFDRFFTVETGRSATGLGLAIAKTLTEQMGGSISAGYSGGRLTIRLAFPP